MSTSATVTLVAWYIVRFLSVSTSLARRKDWFSSRAVTPSAPTWNEVGGVIWPGRREVGVAMMMAGAAAVAVAIAVAKAMASSGSSLPGKGRGKRKSPSSS